MRKHESAFVGPFCKTLLTEGFEYDRVETKLSDGFPDIIAYSKETGRISYIEAKVCEDSSSFVIPIKREQLLFLRDRCNTSKFLKTYVLVFFDKSKDKLLIEVKNDLSFYKLMLDRLDIASLKCATSVVHCTGSSSSIFTALHYGKT